MNSEKKSKINIPIPFLFAIAVLIIAYFCPREGEFGYAYEEGKPWKYGLLTAPYKFPIYKPDVQIEKERDSILANYQPYYSIDEKVLEKSLSQFVQDAQAQSVPDEYINYVKEKLNEIYKAGIISPEDYDKAQHSKSKQIKLFDVTNIAVTRFIFSFYTSKSAYEKMIKEHPDYLEVQVLSSLNLNNYLGNNILYDAETSQKVKDDLIKQVSPAQGMVQSGEKIIDRGEIVTERIYMVLNSLKKVTEETSDSKTQRSLLILGQIILIALFMFSFMTYLMFFRPREYSNRKNVIFMLLMITFFCVLTAITIDYSLFNIYIIPFVIPTIMIRTFIDSRTAMLTHIVTAMICSFMMPFPAEFLTLQIAAGLACIFSLKDLSERSQLIKCSFFIFITYVIVYIGYILTEDVGITQKTDFTLENTKHYWLMLLYFGINFIFVMFTYLLVYMSEKVFGFISNVSLIELSNTNKPLLQKLSEVAPGTFQHSIQVSNLASAVAQRIGANAPLVRTGALYHDIGKMVNPVFFTENQAPGMNPHAGLSYKESAKIIISHVEEGVKIAHKYNLPQQIIDFIQTHHGTGQAKFFYNSYKNEHPDEEVNIADFSYPGPNPFSKETAILMMADTVEAASRSLPEYTEEAISELVERLIDDKLKDGLLKNAPITFRDIELAKSVLKDKLTTIYHTRIVYPKLKEESAKS